MTVTLYPCEGCGGAMHPWAFMRWGVCFECTQARAKCVAKHGRCVCGSKRVAGDEMSNGCGRRWIPCRRCLGSIRQLS